LKQPTGISILGEMVYITDNKNNRIVVFDTSGNYIRTIGESDGLKLPWDNQVDCFGNLFVVDVHNHRIVEFNPWGYQILTFGVKGDSPGQFKLPHGVALSKDGKYLYVCDTYNNRVQKFQMYLGSEEEYSGGIMSLEHAALSNYTLYQNYPNPFKKITEIRYQIADTEGKGQSVRSIELKIYDVSGRLIKTLVNEPKCSGIYKVIWNGRDENGRVVGSGVYFLKFEAGDYTEIKKAVLIK